jgi:hypothetical protein
MIKACPRRTAARRRRLAADMAQHVLDGTAFVCRHRRDCKASCTNRLFYEGQLSYVGKNYDLEVGGRPLRIVAVGQEYGTSQTRVGLSERSNQILRSAAAGFRGRNPHMKRTTSILRLLLGREPGSDPDGEALLGGHIFDGFALVNQLLCTSLREARDRAAFGGGKGASSSTMRSNCALHFLRTLEILEPTVLIVQGQGIRRSLSATLGLPAEPPVNARTGRPLIETITVGGAVTRLLTFDHPSAGGKSGYWGASPASHYLTAKVSPAIAAFRRGETSSGRKTGPS